MGLFSNITNTVSNVKNTVTDAVEEVVDTAVDTGKEVKQTLDNAGKEILNEGKDFVEDCWDTVVDEGEEFIDHLNEGAQTVSKNTEKFIDKAGEMAQTATEKGIDTISTIASSATEEFQELQQDVEDTISLLQNTTPEELADAGWDAIGFSKEERNSLKDSFHEALEATGSFVEEAIQHAVDTGTKVTTDAIEDFIDKMDLPQRLEDLSTLKKGLEDGITGTIDDTMDAVIDASRFINENKEVFEPLADVADNIADFIENEHVQTFLDILSFTTPPGTMDAMQDSLAIHTSILRAAADIPELAEDITNNPTKFKDSVNLLRPGKTVEKIQNLKPGESFKMDLSVSASLVKVDVKGSHEIEFKRLPNNNLAVIIKGSRGIGKGVEKDNTKAGVSLQIQPQIELEIKDDALVNSVMKTLQANLHNSGELDLSDLKLSDNITIKKMAIATPAEANVSLELRKDINAEGKYTLSSEGGFEHSKDGKDAYSSYSVGFEAGVKFGSSDFTIALPDGSKPVPTGIYGQVNRSLELIPPEDLQKIAQSFTNSDSNWSTKAACDLNVKLTNKADGKTEIGAKCTIKLNAGPQTLTVEGEAKVKDLAKLADVLKQDATKLAKDIKDGTLDINDFIQQHPELRPDILDFSYKVTATKHDDIGGAVSVDKAGDLKIMATTSKETVLLDSTNPEVSKNFARNVDEHFNSPIALTKKAATRVHDLMRASGQIMMK